MIALSFLGTGRYESTTYTWDGRACTSQFMPVAIDDLFAPETLLVAETPGAREVHGDALREACSFTSVPVPGQTGEAEWWTMFNALTDAVPEGASLLVDITHGFRSQPFLALAVVLYLRAVKNVTVERIIYGAYEARENGRSPILDLTSFLTLIDWSVATRQFQDYGDAEPLRDMFQEVARESQLGDQVALHLRPAGDRLRRVTRSLALNRPVETLREADGLIGALEDAMDDARTIPQARPVKRLLLLIAERFAPLGHAEGSVFTQRGFAAQAAMLRFYLQTAQYLQGFTLAQEMLISWVCVHHDFETRELGFAGDEDTPPSGRRGAKAMIFTWDREGTLPGGEPMTDREQELTRLWRQVRERRNDVAHAGFSGVPMPSEELVQEAETTLRDVADFFDAG